MKSSLPTLEPTLHAELQQKMARRRSMHPNSAKIIEESYVERMAYCLTATSARYRNDAQALWFSTDMNIPIHFFNSVYRYTFAPGDPHQQVLHVLDQAKFPRIPLFWLVDDADAGIGAYLEEQGGRALGTVWGMIADLDAEMTQPALGPTLSIQRVSTPDQVEAFVDIVTVEESMKPAARQQWIDFEVRLGLAEDLPWQRYLLYRLGEPVASSAIYFGANAAALYHVATVPNARGQRIGATLVRHTLQQAIARNYKQSILLSTPMGVNLYRRLGFAPCSVIHAYYFV